MAVQNDLRNPNQLRHQARRVILLGLGGAGQRILTGVKAWYEDYYGRVPPSVRMLSVDTDINQMSVPSPRKGDLVSLEPSETLHMRVDHPETFLQSEPRLQAWFTIPEPGGVGAIVRGAGAIRQSGRLAFMFHRHTIRLRLDQMVSELHEPLLTDKMRDAGFELQGGDVSVFVCGSLAGGTGSGSVIDMGVLVRHLLPNALVHGFFLLGRPFRNVPFGFRIEQNVYAALSELDMIQSVSLGRHAAETIDYGTERVVVERPPFDLMNLIDGRNEEGIELTTIEELCQVAATAISLGLGSMAANVESTFDNALAHINVAGVGVWNGRNARYCSLGASSLYYPAPEMRREISAAAALEIIERLIGRSGESASAVDVSPLLNRILQAIDLSEATLRDRLVPVARPTFTIDADLYRSSDADQIIEDDWGDAHAALSARFSASPAAAAIDTLAHDFRAEVQAATAGLQNIDQRDLLTQLIEALETSRNGLQAKLHEVQKKAEQGREQVKESIDAIRSASRFFGGGRKNAALDAQDAIQDLLETEWQLMALRRTLDALAALIEQSRSMLPSTDAVAHLPVVRKALAGARQRLRRSLERAQTAIARLRANPTEIVVGNGRLVLLDQDQADHVSEVSGFTQAVLDELDGLNELSPDGIVALGAEGLAERLLEACMARTAVIESMNIMNVLDWMRATPDWKTYPAAELERAIRLAAPLWRFRDGALGLKQIPQYARFVDIGFVRDGYSDAFEADIETAKDRLQLTQRHSCSPGDDPFRVRILSIGAALPVHILDGLEPMRQRYMDSMNPTFHVHRDWERRCPDLFPPDPLRSQALRVLALAILPGIDVIKDDKIGGGRGHVFTCQVDRVNNLNPDGQLSTWTEFTEMLAHVAAPARHQKPSQLLVELTDALTAKYRSIQSNMSDGDFRDWLKERIDLWAAEVERKLDERRHERLLSLRLHDEEVRALRRLVRPAPHGYDLDLHAYIYGH